MYCLCSCLVLAGLTGGLALAAGEKKQESNKVLFNGKDLSGWKFRGGEKAAAKSKWSVVDSVALDPKMPNRLVAKPGTGVLLSGDDGRGVDLLTPPARLRLPLICSNKVRNIRNTPFLINRKRHHTHHVVS